MRITHIIPALSRGGAERVVVELANEGIAAGHDVTVLAATFVDPALLRDSLRPEVEVSYICPSGPARLRKYWVLLPWLWRHRRWLTGQDVIHCHLTFGSFAGGAVQVLRRFCASDRPRVVETFHGVGMPIPKLTRAVSRLLAKGRDGYALMAEDDYWRRFIARHPELPVVVIPNGIDTRLEQPNAADRAGYRTEIGIPASCGFVVGSIGRLVAERKPLEMVAAFAEMARLVGPDVHFVMAGAGPMLEPVRAEAERRGLAARLHLPGLITHPARTLSVMDLYVGVNVGPTPGVAGLEAAAAGVPMVALQALEGYISESDWIWSSSDPAALAAYATSLIADGDLLARLARLQQDHVRAHHSSEAMAKAYERLYARAGAGGTDDS